MDRSQSSRRHRNPLPVVVVSLMLAAGITGCERGQSPGEGPRSAVPPVSATAETAPLGAVPSAPRWSVPPNPGLDPRRSGPVAGDARQVLMRRVVDAKQFVDVVDAATGRVRHVVEPGFDVDTCAVAGNGRTALCAEMDRAGRSAAIDLETGTVTHFTDGIPSGSVEDVSDDTYVVLGSPDGGTGMTDVRLLGSDGRTVWGDGLRGLTSLSGSGVVVSQWKESGRSTVVAYGITDGRKVLSREYAGDVVVSGYVGGLMIDDGDRTEIYDSAGRAVARAPAGWRAMQRLLLALAPGARVPSVPILIDRKQRRIAAFSPNDGARIWERPLPEEPACGPAEAVQGVGRKVVLITPVGDATDCTPSSARMYAAFDAYTGDPGPRFRFGADDHGYVVGTDGTHIATASGPLQRTLTVWNQGPQPLWSREYGDASGGGFAVRAFGGGIYAHMQRVI